MKHLLFFILALFLLRPVGVSGQANPKAAPNVGAVNAQVFPIQEPAVELKPESYYQNQQYWWSQKVRLEPKNADAWYNYYQAVRLTGFEAGNKSVNPNTQQQLSRILGKMEQQLGSKNFEYQYLAYLEQPNDSKAYDHLKQAFLFDPNRSEIYDDLAALAEQKGDKVEREEVILRMAQSGLYSEGILQYNRNVLHSIDSNGILFTNGTYDTYPLWVLQQIHSLRTDVQILNLDLLGNAEYRNKRYEELGLTEVSEGDPIQDKASYFAAFVQANPGRPLHFGLTIDRQAIREVKDRLYLTGLTFRYSEQRFDNLSLLAEVWENQFDRKDLETNSTNSTERNLKQNYSVPLALLALHYHQLGEKEQADQVKLLALQLAGDSTRKTQLTRYFDKTLR